MLDNDIKTLIKILEESNIDELEVSTFWGRQKIRIRKGSLGNDHKIDLTNDTARHKPVEENSDVSQLSIIDSDEIIKTETVETIKIDELLKTEKNSITIKAPLVGTFYMSPKSGTPPFIAEGDEITKGQIVCIIEAMKIFNEIESEYSGRILKILVKDATPVEYDQELFIISSE